MSMTITKYVRIGLLLGCIAAVEAMPGLAAQGLPDVTGRRPPTPEQIQMEKARLKQASKERQAAIKKDTDKLLKLATELKQYVDKTNENTLSMDVVKKAAEIEKLAKEVKERMKEGY
jgi:hypothetical protein